MATTPTLEIKIGLPDGSKVAVIAELGIQEFGNISGNPLDLTRPGAVYLFIEDKVGEAQVKLYDDHLDNLIAALESARKYRDSRDRSLDQRRPQENQ